MNKEIFIEGDRQFTLETYVPIASQTVALIAEAADGLNKIGVTLSIADLSALFDKVIVCMAGEFEMRRTPSRYYQIVYKPYVLNAAEFDVGYLSSDFVDLHAGVDLPAGEQTCLWITDKVLFAFIDRKLYGVAFMLYFYLGYLMTRDATFAVSHNISFAKILTSCDEFPEDHRVKYRTTIMRAIADLEDVGLIKWNVESSTFELLYITPYDPNIKV